MPDFNDRIHETLPVYSLERKEGPIIYAPGLAIKVSREENQALRAAFTAQKPSALSENLKQAYLNIYDHALKKQESYNAYLKKDFFPLSLTLNISNECNFNCVYCYTRSSVRETKGILSKRTAEAAARAVAANCKAVNKPLTVVFHGGGEPSFHWEYLKELFCSMKSIAGSFQIPLFSYISTNGFLKPEQAGWLASNINLIGVSIDGTPEWQDRNRKTTSGDKTSDTVAKTIEIINQIGGNVQARSTVTPENMLCQEEMARYLISRLRVKTIRFEPKYGQKGSLFREPDAELFAENFIAARNLARASGAVLNFSGVRLNEIHGVYCDVLRDNLRIGPGDTAENCFFRPGHGKYFTTGMYDQSIDRFNLNNASNTQAIKKAACAHNGCRNCFLQYHCSRGCPDVCWNDEDKAPLSAFRCQLHRHIALHLMNN